MAVANTKSTHITNADATPMTVSGAHLTRGVLLEAVATVEVAAADDNNSVYRMVRLRSSDRISQVTIWNDAMTGATDWDLGIYRTTADGGAAVTVDCYAQAVDINAGLSGTELLFEVNNIDKVEKRVWEILGLSEDPNLEYDLCLTGVAAGSGAGTITLRVRYVSGV